MDRSSIHFYTHDAQPVWRNGAAFDSGLRELGFDARLGQLAE